MAVRAYSPVLPSIELFGAYEGIASATSINETVSLTFTPTSEGNLTIVPYDGDDNISQMQLEVGPTPSSYIPTSGSTVTRAADSLTVAAADLPWPTPNVIGSELVTNGTFDTDSDWNKGTGVTISGGTINFSGSPNNTTQPAVASANRGKLLYIEYEITSVTSGAMQIFVQQTSPTVITRYAATGNSLGVKSGIFLVPDNASTFGFNTSNFVGSIDNISVREIDPLAVSIQMQGRMTYADNDSTEAVFWRWYIDNSNRMSADLRASGALTGQPYFFQSVNGTFDDADGGINAYSPGINVPYNIASRHGSTFLNGSVDGTALTADTTPTALPDLSSTDLDLAFDYNGTIKLVRIWNEDVGDSGIEEASQ